MAIPETYDLVLPLLEIIKDKDEYKVQEITEEVIDYIDISDEDKEITLPNNEPVINSRISTANTYLKKAELIESNRFMYFNITEEGLRVLDENPDKITEEDLMEYDGFREYKKVFIHDDTKDLDINELNPTDALRESFKKQMESVQKEIEDEIVRLSVSIRNCKPIYEDKVAQRVCKGCYDVGGCWLSWMARDDRELQDKMKNWMEQTI